MRSHQYGWIYDKQGNKKEILAPESVIGICFEKHTRVRCGAIHDSVGFSGYKPKQPIQQRTPKKHYDKEK